MSRADRLLRACRREPVDTTPIWLMRQAGRYLPEYRAIRAKHGFLEMVKTPALAVEVTLQPIERFELDAAIIFADILTVLQAMGLPLEFREGDGPALTRPIRSAADVEALAVSSVEETLDYTLTAIRLTRKELNGKVPLIGFSGAPFTLASYAIEGGGSREFLRTKYLMYHEPRLWHRLMEKLATMVGEYLKAQAAAGAQVLQLFDSWVGALGPGDYREYVLPHSARALQIAATGHEALPLIHFGTNAGGFLPLLREAGGTVIGVDWRQDLGEAWDRLGEDVAVQGNLDPAVLLGSGAELQRQATRVLDAANNRPGHVFNLGHGLIKDTPPENVAALVDFVHEYARRPQA